MRTEVLNIWHKDIIIIKNILKRLRNINHWHIAVKSHSPESGNKDSCSESVLSFSEVVGFLLLFQSLKSEFVLGHSLSVSSSLLHSQVHRSVLLLRKISSCLISSLLIDHSQDLSDGLSGALNADA